MAYGPRFDCASRSWKNHLFGTFEEFELILFSPGTDQLTLWYFAKAWQRLEENTKFCTRALAPCSVSTAKTNTPFIFLMIHRRPDCCMLNRITLKFYVVNSPRD